MTLGAGPTEDRPSARAGRRRDAAAAAAARGRRQEGRRWKGRRQQRRQGRRRARAHRLARRLSALPAVLVRRLVPAARQRRRAASPAAHIEQNGENREVNGSHVLQKLLGPVLLLPWPSSIYILTTCSGSGTIEQLTLSHNVDNTRKRPRGHQSASTCSALSSLKAATAAHKPHGPVSSSMSRRGERSISW